jgi:hypothetical protein
VEAVVCQVRSVWAHQKSAATMARIAVVTIAARTIRSVAEKRVAQPNTHVATTSVVHRVLAVKVEVNAVLKL